VYGHSRGSIFVHRKLRLFKIFTQLFATVSLKGSRYAHANGIKPVQEFRERSEKLTVRRYEEQVGVGYVCYRYGRGSLWGSEALSITYIIMIIIVMSPLRRKFQ
jgi:hypothetical protein